MTRTDDRGGAAGWTPGPPTRPAGGGRWGYEARSALGPLLAVADDASVTDLLLNGDGSVWVDRGAGLERCDLPDLAEPERRRLAVRLVSLGGRHVDEATPCVDVRLERGVRVHVALAGVSVAGTSISIRIPREAPLSFDALVASGFVPAWAERPLRAAVAARRNVLVTGAAGTGKTTLLGALLGLAAPTERIVTVEDVAELTIAHPHVVALEARQANLEGRGALDLAILVRQSLRMRPDRLVVGECRGAELRELLAALNTGHDGGAGTLHANSLGDVPARLEALGALAGLPADALARQAVSALDLVVHLERVGGARGVGAIGELRLDPRGRLATTRLPAAAA